MVIYGILFGGMYPLRGGSTHDGTPGNRGGGVLLKLSLVVTWKGKEMLYLTTLSTHYLLLYGKGPLIARWETH